ncbi:hypothetical protein [Proteus mirabilis]|uniref:hypothetical protein n=1 Tax=Proteus mirabilis TaxID=584 RepID=UPI003556976E
MKIKCIKNKGNEWFKVGNTYKAWVNTHGELWSESDSGVDCFHVSMNNSHGVFEILEEEKSHLHADLMLKYAMIAQYDDKPWESFEFKNQYTHSWMGVVDHPCWDAENEYRLKPQEPKIKVGQIWVDVNGVEVEIRKLSTSLIFTDIGIAGLIIPWSFSEDYFLQNFKLKENK